MGPDGAGQLPRLDGPQPEEDRPPVPAFQLADVLQLLQAARPAQAAFQPLPQDDPAPAVPAVPDPPPAPADPEPEEARRPRDGQVSAICKFQTCDVPTLASLPIYSFPNNIRNLCGFCNLTLCIS